MTGFLGTFFLALLTLIGDIGDITLAHQFDLTSLAEMIETGGLDVKKIRLLAG